MSFKKTIFIPLIVVTVLYLYFVYAGLIPEGNISFSRIFFWRGPSPWESVRLIDRDIVSGLIAEFSGEREIKALAKAYPDRIDKVEKRDGEWALLLDGEWFYWQGGRLLPESELEGGEVYREFGFYDYPLELPDEPPAPDEKQISRLERKRDVPVNSSFLDRLYGGASYTEIRRNLENIAFLGYRFDAHRRIVPVLRAVEEEIKELMAEDESAERFIGILRNIECFSWREIDRSMRRSYHSYGIAVDLIPADAGGKAVYWVWTRYYKRRWHDVPYERRWMVPEEIVNIFEKYGFIWGGKWLFYDNMHFEYRPELLILAGRDIKMP